MEVKSGVTEGIFPMGRTKGPYKEEYPRGACVELVSRKELEDFVRTWRWHHPLIQEQLRYAGQKAIVKNVSFYHGGDELYELEGIPGIWHECCLRSHS